MSLRNDNWVVTYANRKKKFNGEPESIEDYLKRGGTVTKLKDEPELLLKIEMMQ